MATSDIKKGPLYVDSTNNVIGVGTSSPSTTHKLTLNHTANYGGISLKQSGTQIGQIIQEGGTGNVYIDADSSGLGGGLIFRTTGGTTRMTVDGSGRVTMPYQPAFRAYGNTQGAISSGEFTGYTTTNFNIGSHFSTSTGRFTAPVNGVYFFRADFRSNQAQGSGNVFVDIRVNGANVICRHEEVGASFNAYHQTFAGIIYMNAGDYASIIVGGGGSNFQPDNSTTDSFAGFLVG